MKRILIISQKGGTGKTTLANEIAHSMSRTADITPYSYYDLDSQGGSVFDTSDNPDAIVSVIDTPGYLTDDAPDLIADADVIVLPTRASVLDIPPLERMRELIRTHAPATPVILVVNAWNRFINTTSFTDWIQESRKPNETLVLIPQSEAIPQSTALERSVTEYAPRTRAAERIRQLTNAVREKADLVPESVIKYIPRNTTQKESNGRN